MKSPFPGMDPYLESRWSDVHTKLVAYIGEALQPCLPPALRARSEERVLVESTPDESGRLYRADVAVVDTGRFPETPAAPRGGVATIEPVVIGPSLGPTTDRFVLIIDVTTGNRVVTAIEILSPWNKSPGRLNQDYLRKLEDYARGEVSVVEIDLLRYPPRHRLPVTESDIPPHRRAPYLVCVRRGWSPERWEAYPLSLRQSLPRVPVPLRRSDADVGLDLQPLIERVYAAGGHDDIDYGKPPEPALDGADAAWAEQLLLAGKKR